LKIENGELFLSRLNPGLSNCLYIRLVGADDHIGPQKHRVARADVVIGPYGYNLYNCPINRNLFGLYEFSTFNFQFSILNPLGLAYTYPKGVFYGLQIYGASVQRGGLHLRRVPPWLCVGCAPGGAGGEGGRSGGAGQVSLGRSGRAPGGLHHTLELRLQDRAGYHSGGYPAG
jgi:hypothetical protein